MIKHKIVLVPFPFDDFSATKVRPAVCLTNTIGEYHHVIIAFISSKTPNIPAVSDIVIRENIDDFSITGLAVNSVVRLHRLVTIPKNLIKRQLGELSATQQHAVNKKLKLMFELQ
ncbi:type II toxin-antitoxin system PemK/MazF family toxin [Cyclobacterium salsum]|uniref:type II toxin-antitoxin system PemK/MazF family toxin n=1 Tax=Cyclobacterium salsum TaxID=2666329 RepID=UPI001F1B8D08|nr:type II toxin-antitoxin system PemK/MazF family toxin [Cyclobacterium salsum]